VTPAYDTGLPGLPDLVVAAHGTRFAPGNAVARDLARAAAERLGVPVRAAYVELCEPLLAQELTAAARPTVVLPLLLSTGFHVRHDLPEMAAAAPVEVTVAAPLGPDPLLAAAQVRRLQEAGATPGQPVVLVAAGSRDPAADADLHSAAALLAEAWGCEARLATLAGRGVRPCDVVRPGDAVSPYLLAPGHFATRAAEHARAAGAAVVADVLGTAPSVVDLVARRLAAVAPLPVG
jgi:sirohydrochlorin ferrochelatase